jgi:molybdate-binding protein/DNA-binding XRE family transcriptional regulator
MSNTVSERRRALGLTQTDLAVASRLSRPLISAVETGRHVPSVRAALAIAAVLGSTVEEIFGTAGVPDEPLPALGASPSGTVPVLAVRVGETLTYHPLANHGAAGSRWSRADGLYRDGRIELFGDADLSGFAVAGCEPALGLAASMLPAGGPQRLLSIPSSSAAAIDALDTGRIHAAVVHGRPGHLRRSSHPVSRFVIAGWRVGIASRADRPVELEEVARGRVRVVRRDEGAESQRALERALAPYGGAANPGGPPASGHLDAARQIASGAADVGVTMEAAALAYRLSFTPLEDHRVELRIAEDWEDHPGARALLDLLSSTGFRRRLEALGGYDTSQEGPVG